MDTVYQLKITLKHSQPPIWRRVQVRANINLHDLHRVIQVVMGWTNSHLHQFIVRGVYYGDDDPDFGLGSELEFISEHKIGLDQIVSQEKEKLIYEYDFGDGWEHQIVVEKILQPESTRSYPNCLTGKRACPPEDVGGVWGYDNFVEIIRDKKHPEHKAMLEWVGGDFDPEEFNMVEVSSVADRRLPEGGRRLCATYHQREKERDSPLHVRGTV
ncbi:MAG: plasmid pRiA4b ORF-3 family protein [Candidatus Jettenia sp. CY-1]|nr:MAG: plasmid pRiA4b ORF-3 family protein [Candidatus Jettenia sp. CY-1]